MNDEDHSAIAEHQMRVAEQFEVAEKRLKNFEDTHGEGLVVPSLNELRYAGNHLLNSLVRCDGDIEKQKDQLRLAEKHCLRASYDASAALLSYLFYSHIRFRDKYVANHFHHVIAVIPNYTDYVDNFKKAQKIVQDVKLNDGKEEYYKSLEELLTPINEWIDTLHNEYIPQIDALIRPEEREIARSNKQFNIMLGVTIVAVVIAAIGLFT